MSAPETESQMRLQRALARAGVASRRASEELIESGRVKVNGKVATIGQSVTIGVDEITVDGKPISAPSKQFTWIVLNKPNAVLTTKSDPRGRKTVFDLVEDQPGLTYVGRLDYMTEGVLLLTTDGDAAHKLTHPSNELERTYVATVRGDVASAVRQARRGVELEDGFVQPLHVAAVNITRGLWDLELTIAEGRNREVRRLCEALELSVERLVRTQFGPVKLGLLQPGETRGLTRKEQDLIEALTKQSSRSTSSGNSAGANSNRRSGRNHPSRGGGR